MMMGERFIVKIISTTYVRQQKKEWMHPCLSCVLNVDIDAKMALKSKELQGGWKVRVVSTMFNFHVTVSNDSLLFLM